MANYQRISGRRWAKACRLQDWGGENVLDKLNIYKWVILAGVPYKDDYMSVDLVLRAINALQAHGGQFVQLNMIFTDNSEGGMPAPMSSTVYSKPSRQRAPRQRYLVDEIDSLEVLQTLRDVEEMAILLVTIETQAHTVYLQQLEDDWLLVRTRSSNVSDAFNNDFFMCDGMNGFQECLARELHAD